jgi:hypothetical protein
MSVSSHRFIGRARSMGLPAAIENARCLSGPLLIETSTKAVAADAAELPNFGLEVTYHEEAWKRLEANRDIHCAQRTRKPDRRVKEHVPSYIHCRFRRHSQLDAYIALPIAPKLPTSGRDDRP